MNAILDSRMNVKKASKRPRSLGVLTGKKAKGGDETTPWMDRLVDVLLSLLANASGHLPSAPLREAVEGLFRLFAGQLTPTGQPLACNTAHRKGYPSLRHCRDCHLRACAADHSDYVSLT